MESCPQNRRAATSELFGSSSDAVRKNILKKASREIADLIEDFLLSSDEEERPSDGNIEVIAQREEGW